MSQGQRRLVAVMFTDMVGYTALGQRSESLSLALVEEQRKLVRQILSRHDGREVKTMGDAFLVEFPNAVDAVRCAYDIQRAIREFNLSLAADKRIHLRIGVHVGEVVESQGDISGDAVNIASRIEPLAEDGGVCITRQVYDHVQNKVDLPMSNIGPKSLKNVTEPMEIYKMVMPWEKEMASPSLQLDARRIAVLPFSSLSPDPDDEYFADGLTEELIDRLCQVRELGVIARTSVMSYKKNGKKASEIGRELKAGALVEGSVRKSGNKIRVTAQLINSNTEEHIWSSRYDGDLEDIFGIQSEIATKVADELRIQLVGSEKRMLERRSTGNTEAYTYFLQGRELLREGSEPSIRKAIGLFERAIQLDSSFARAYSALATCYQRLGNEGYEPYWESLAREKVPLKKALDLDPDLAEAHASLSVMLFNEDDVIGAEAEARRAIELNPSLPEAYDVLSNVMWLKGDTEEGTRLVETYYRLDPIRPSYVRDLGNVYFYLGRESEALEHWKKTVELSPAGTYRLMTEYYLSKGNHEKAKEFHSMAEKLQPTHPWVTWMKGFIAASIGDKEGALGAVRHIETSRGNSGLNDIAFIYYALGNLDSYFDYLNRALDLHSLEFVYPIYCPLFREGKNDPRFQELMEKMRNMFWPKRN